ncbi:hypothetical protein AGMMS50276_17780 [Synergistales bacterium]|nr:hypothetical protein AGMMS50276_17780 [Synergistales bacterium]
MGVIELYFLWKLTPHGSIRISRGGLSCFVERILPEKSQCRGLSFEVGETPSMTVVLISDGLDKSGIEEKISALSAPLGFKVHVVWAEGGLPGSEFCETLSSLAYNPWAWMFLSVAVSLALMTGLKELFWTFFWGTAAWFVSKFLIAFAARKKARAFLSAARR